MTATGRTSGRTKRAAVLAALWGAAALGALACYEKHGAGPGVLNDPLDAGQQAEKARLQMVPGALNLGSITPQGQDDPYGGFLAAEQLTAAGKSVNIVQMDALDYPEGSFDARLEGMVDAGLPVILTSSSGDMLESYAIGQPADVLCISNGATSTEISGVPRPPDLLFRTCPTDAVTGSLLARLTYDEITATAGTGSPPFAGVLSQADDSYSDSLSSAFITAYQGLGGTVRAVQFAATSSGFTNDAIDTALTAMFASPAPTRVVLISQANPDPASVVLIEWVRLGFGSSSKPSAQPPPWIWCDAITVPFLINNLPGAIRGACDSALGVSLSRGVGPGFGQFSADFAARFGKSPVEFVANAYDAVALLGLAAQRAETVSGTANPTGAELAPHLRAVANGGPGAVTVTAGVASLAAGLQAIRAGHEVHYRGAYSSFGFDPLGDLDGEAAYTIVRFNAVKTRFDTVANEKISVP